MSGPVTVVGSPITVVGTGTGAPLPAGVLDGARLVVGGRRHLAVAAVPAGAEQVVLGPLAPALDAIERHLDRRSPVVVLASGDPGYFGIVRVLAARLMAVRQAAAQDAPALEVDLKPRGQTAAQTLTVAAVVNCTGPSTAIGSASQPLLRQLAQDGLLVPDPYGLGLQVDDRLQIIGARGQAVDGLWYVGPMLRARDWEATAAPELRVHAQRLAESIAACEALSTSTTSV